MIYMEDLDKGDDFFGVCQFFLVNVPCAWPKWSFQISCLNKNVDLLNFQFCGGVLQHPHCVRALTRCVYSQLPCLENTANLK